MQRPLWIRWLLTQDYTVLQCDVDIVWLRMCNNVNCRQSMDSDVPKCVTVVD